MHAKAVLIYKNAIHFIDILRGISLRPGKKNPESNGLRDNNDGNSNGRTWEPAFKIMLRFLKLHMTKSKEKQ